MKFAEKISDLSDRYVKFRFRVIYIFLKIIWPLTFIWGLYDSFRWLRQTPAQRLVNPEIGEGAIGKLAGGIILLLLWLLYRTADRRSAAKSKLP